MTECFEYSIKNDTYPPQPPQPPHPPASQENIFPVASVPVAPIPEIQPAAAPNPQRCR